MIIFMHCLPLDAQMNNLECGQSENFKNKPIGNLANQNQIKYNEQQRCGEYKFANKPERKRY